MSKSSKVSASEFAINDRWDPSNGFGAYSLGF